MSVVFNKGSSHFNIYFNIHMPSSTIEDSTQFDGNEISTLSSLMTIWSSIEDSTTLGLFLLEHLPNCVAWIILLRINYKHG